MFLRVVIYTPSPNLTPPHPPRMHVWAEPLGVAVLHFWNRIGSIFPSSPPQTCSYCREILVVYFTVFVTILGNLIICFLNGLLDGKNVIPAMQLVQFNSI